VKKLCGEDTSSVSPTLGFQIKTVHRDGCILNIWDVGGQKSLRSYWKNYFERTDALIWVLDSADWNRMKDCVEELVGLLEDERLAGATLLLLANKQDMPGSLSVEDINEKYLRLDRFSGQRNWKISPCSGYTGQGLHDSFSWLVQNVESRLFLLN
jgi:ADP-ribosylation factor-like protein 2